MSAYLYGAAYELGEIEADHTTIANLAERAEQYRMPMNPMLWGWGTFRRTERNLAELAVASGLATLRAARLDPSDIDAMILCSTSIRTRSEDDGALVQTVLRGIGLGDIAFYGITLNRCTNLLAALDLAAALVEAGRYQRVLAITIDRVLDEADRMGSYALFSDGAASCVVGAHDDGPDGYQILGCANAQDIESLEWKREISADLSRRVNELLLAPHGMKVGDLAGVMHLNIFTPLVVMKERQAGFTAEQIHTDNVARVGHCYAADSLINLVDRVALDHVLDGQFVELAASVPGSRFGVLMRKGAP